MKRGKLRICFLTLLLCLLAIFILPNVSAFATEPASMVEASMIEKQKSDISEYFQSEITTLISDNCATEFRYRVENISGKATINKSGVVKAVKNGTVDIHLQEKSQEGWMDVPNAKTLRIAVLKPVTPKMVLCNFLNESQKLSDVLDYEVAGVSEADASGSLLLHEPSLASVEILSSNASVLAVDNENRTFTPVSYGNAVLTIKYTSYIGAKNEQKVYATVTKKIKVSCKEPKFNIKDKTALKIGKTKTIRLLNLPKNADVLYTSDNDKALEIQQVGAVTKFMALDDYSAVSVNAVYMGHTFTTNIQNVDAKGKIGKDPSKEPAKEEAKEPDDNPTVTSKMEVHFMDVGQGDATLITCGEHAMLIDAGPDEKGTAIQLYLQKQGISSLDYIVITHYDTDHAGGADVILQKFDCQTIIMPDYVQDNTAYRNIIQVMKGKNYKFTTPVAGTEYMLGDAKITLLSPVGAYTDDANNNSICLRVDHGTNSFLFTGDADSSIEKALMASGQNLDVDVFKIAHHGSKYSNSEEFIKKISPKYAVISCGANNSYYHPHAAVLNILRAEGISTYRTDEQGLVLATSKDNTITFNMSPSTTWKAGEGSGTGQIDGDEPTPEPSGGNDVDENTTYVLNTNTLKFHVPTCGSVAQMSEKNKQCVTWTREECVNQGYSPCGNCKP